VTRRPRFAVAPCKHTGADPCERRACRYFLPLGLKGEHCTLEIIEQRHGDGMTLHEVGLAFGVGRERIRQIEALALVRLTRRVAAAMAEVLPCHLPEPVHQPAGKRCVEPCHLPRGFHRGRERVA
jgi:hypothetical protein